MEAVELSALDYDSLRTILLQERSQSSLEPLKEDFFDQCSNFVDLQERLLKEKFSLEQAKILENSKKMVGELRQVRLRKILFKSLKDFETNAINSSGLTADEKEFYRSAVSLVAEYAKKSGGKTQSKLRILVDLPKIQTPTGETCGPFSAGQTAVLGEEAAELLLQKKVAEKI